jgi:asparagine synthase (glutamine-hydrolysing)
VCGIAGIVRLDQKLIDQASFYEALTSMRHRGPDDEGAVLIDSLTGKFEERGGQDSAPDLRLIDFRVPTNLHADIVLGNRRLSIIDLSAGGHQPQHNEDCTIWVVLNGEVYNYRELRNDLTALGHAFIGDSDTEVIVHGYEEWGLSVLLSKMVGMWGFALWDQRLRKLYICRDRFGIKPLYYSLNQSQLIFASEIKAIRKIFPSRINEQRVSEYLWFKPYKHDETFFEGINQVMASYYAELDLESKSFSSARYWELSDINQSYNNTDFKKAAQTFYGYFEQSIRLHLRSDVTVGTCLSGGLDSSTIVCLAQKLLDQGSITEKGLSSVKKLKSFSSAPQEKQISEIPYVEEVIRHNNIEPYFVAPTFDDFVKDFDEIVSVHDEPFQDPSTYMGYRVIKLAKECGIKVLLDGQGADECLAGYQRYLRDYLKDLASERKYVKTLVEFLLTLDLTAPFIQRYLRTRLGIREKAIGEVVKIKPPDQRPPEYPIYNLATRLRYDLLAGSIIELLKYEDTNSMAFSIESRVPFLFHPLIEYIFGLPMTAKINNGWTKYVLREAMTNILPKKIRKRRSKLGFPAPSKEWAKKLVRERQDLCIEVTKNAESYVNLSNFEKLCKRILLRGRSEDVELFWRIMLISKWLEIMNKIQLRQT